jgi:AcrR family transcriptional regulator
VFEIKVHHNSNTVVRQDETSVFNLLAMWTGRPLSPGGSISERSDAARNRAKVLAAAERLFAVRDLRRVTMDAIAREAGVGRATLYRRYPDPQSIAVALLDEHGRRLQEKIIYGAPPLGPGAPPHERLTAFYEAMIDLLDTHLHLALGAETGSLRFRTGAYRFWRTHVRMLAATAEIPQSEAMADVLLAPLAPEVYQHMRGEGLSRRQIADAVGQLATLLS